MALMAKQKTDFSLQLPMSPRPEGSSEPFPSRRDEPCAQRNRWAEDEKTRECESESYEPEGVNSCDMMGLWCVDGECCTVKNAALLPESASDMAPS